MKHLPPERLRRIDEVLAAALEQPAAGRTAFLEHACDADDELRREVDALLAGEAESERLLGEGAADFAAPLMSDLRDGLAESTEDLPPGTRVGPYRIVREIGRGGMGAVYLAERDDEQYRKRVALKLVKRGMDTDEVLLRFRHERQILASLEHPNIAALHDGGVSDDGRPYLVMEYVEGVPIDAYCEQRDLGVAARIALFRTVCGAVQYAHQKLVVHRDLKPSNILVAPDGTPKLLDFGIAKLLDESEADDTPHTRTGMRVLTPEYASPEQLRGEPVTTTSDVYALGTVLYKLLTGRRPYEGKAEAVREPPRPSAVAHSDRLRRRLRGDLDTITLKALEEEPVRRYPSAGTLADDLRRHLSGLPIEAHPAGRAYRAAKFVRRHRAGVAAAAVVLLSLLGGLGGALWQAGEAARERDVAERERDKAEEVAGFLEGLFAASDPFAPESERLDTLPVRAFLERGAGRLGREFEGRPLVRAQMQSAVGRVYHRLGLYEDAESLFASALATRTEALGPAHPEVAESLARMAAVLTDRGEYERARRLHDQSLAIRIRAFGSHDPRVAVGLNDLGVLLRARGLYDEAEGRQREALAILHEALGDERHRVAEVTHSLAGTLEYKGDYGGSESLLRETLALRRTLYGDHHPHVASDLNDLAFALQRQGRYDEAEVLVREALPIGERALGGEHPLVADILYRLASVLYWKRDYESAEPLHRRSLALQRKLYGDTHVKVSTGLSDLASLLRAKGDLDAAEAAGREAVAIVREALGSDHPDVAIATGNLATTLRAKGDCAAAEPMFRDVLARFRSTLSPDHVRIPLTQRLQGACLTTLGRYDEAEPMLLESYRVLHAGRGSEDQFTREAQGYLVDLYDAWGRPEKAAEYRGLPGAVAGTAAGPR